MKLVNVPLKVANVHLDTGFYGCNNRNLGFEAVSIYTLYTSKGKYITLMSQMTLQLILLTNFPLSIRYAIVK